METPKATTAPAKDERLQSVAQRDPKDTLREIDERWQTIRKTATPVKRVSLL